MYWHRDEAGTNLYHNRYWRNYQDGLHCDMRIGYRKRARHLRSVIVWHCLSVCVPGPACVCRWLACWPHLKEFFDPLCVACIVLAAQ